MGDQHDTEPQLRQYLGEKYDLDVLAVEGAVVHKHTDEVAGAGLGEGYVAEVGKSGSAARYTGQVSPLVAL